MAICSPLCEWPDTTLALSTHGCPIGLRSKHTDKLWAAVLLG